MTLFENVHIVDTDKTYKARMDGFNKGKYLKNPKDNGRLKKLLE